MDKNISHIITEFCKKNGIEYKSINPNYIEYYSDAQVLGQIYRDLKEAAGKLQEISERHNINGLHKLLEDDINLIEKVDHDLIKLAHKLNQEKK